MSITTTKEKKMNRRELVGLTTAAAAASLFSQSMAAESKNKTKPAGGASKLSQLSETALECAKVGEKCVAFCTNQLAQGDTMMAKCLGLSQNMVAACHAMARIALHENSKPATLKAMAVACAATCRDCMEECKKHVGHHEICKECFEHCEKCVKACEAA